jgi:hypothetical protein
MREQITRAKRVWTGARARQEAAQTRRQAIDVRPLTGAIAWAAGSLRELTVVAPVEEPTA